MLKKLLDVVLSWFENLTANFESGVPKARRWRVLYLLSTVVAPWGCLLLLASQKFGEAEWQDGQFSTYVDLTFSNQIWPIFAPFLIFASVSMLLLLINPQRFSQYALVRFGIYSGTFLAIQYSLQLVFTTDLIFVFVFGVLGVLLLFVGVPILTLTLTLLYLMWQHRPDLRNAFNFSAVVLVIILLLLNLFSLQFAANALILLFFVPLTFLLCALITLCVPITLLTSAQLLTSKQLHPARPLLFPLLSVGWISGYAVAWYTAINRVFELYEQMPEQPNCYIATASVNAHPSVVRSVTIYAAAGNPVRISRQLQILKAGELILQATAPHLHAFVRRHYDVFGRQMAIRINNRLVATVSYLLLKPLEWLTFCLIKLVLPQQLPAIYRFYTRL